MSMLRFIHMSDIHFRASYYHEGFEALLAQLGNPLDNLRVCLENEKRLGLDFVLITGDITHDGDELDYRELRRALDEQLGDVPLVAVPGNHDCREAYCRGFLGVGPEEKLDGVLEKDGLRIITIDSGDGIDGFISPSQISWLKDVLAAPAEKGSLLALHHTLIPGQDGLGCARYGPGLPEIIVHSDIMGIFCGHTHGNYFGLFATKPYFTADSIFFSMITRDRTMLLKNHAAYNLATLDNGALSVQVRQVVPEPAVSAGFDLDKLSQLLSKRK